MAFYFLPFQDILHTVIEFTTPPVPNHMLNQVFVLRNLSAALSACIYQCLCDSDNFIVAMSDNIDVGMEGFTRLVEAWASLVVLYSIFKIISQWICIEKK